MTDPHRPADETYALVPLRRQLTVLLGLCGLATATIVVCLTALFFYLHDFTNRASVLGAKADYLEKQSAEIKRISADLTVQLTQLGERIERVQSDIAKLRPGSDQTAIKPTITDAAVPRGEPNEGSGEENRNESAGPEAGNAAIGSIDAPPLPRPRFPAVRGAPVAGTVDLKVGSVISPAQFALQPLPDELEDKLPRLRGKLFFRHNEQIFVVDPKNNRIVELLN